MRIDKYLKVSRIIKRRTVAQEVCDASRILINGKPVKPSKEVKIGDIVTVEFGNRTLSVRVLSIENTQSKEKAATMYEVINEG